MNYNDTGKNVLWTFRGIHRGVFVYPNGAKGNDGYRAYDKEAKSIGLDGWAITCDIRKARVWDDRHTYSFNLYFLLNDWIPCNDRCHTEVISLDESFRARCEDNAEVEYCARKREAEKKYAENAMVLRNKYNQQ